MAEFESFICFEMKVLMRKIERYITRRLDESGLNFGQSLILFCLLEQDGQTLTEIAAMAKIENSSLTTMADKLEKMGLVKRKSDAGNRRVVKLFITPRGRELGEKVLEMGRKFNVLLQEHLGTLEEPLHRAMAVIDEVLEREVSRENSASG